MPTTKRSLVTCSCKHHKSAHDYIPDDSVKRGPQCCTVPGCKCEVFVSRRAARLALRRDISEMMRDLRQPYS